MLSGFFITEFYFLLKSTKDLRPIFVSLSLLLIGIIVFLFFVMDVSLQHECPNIKSNILPTFGNI